MPCHKNKILPFIFGFRAWSEFDCEVRKYCIFAALAYGPYLASGVRFVVEVRGFACCKQLFWNRCDCAFMESKLLLKMVQSDLCSKYIDVLM